MTVTLSPLRKGRITGSRIAGALGLDPYRTRSDVMREMVREHFGDEPEFTGNIATEWGNAREPISIEQFEWLIGKPVTHRQQFVIHPKIDWLAVTLDGRVDGKPAEFKNPYSAGYTDLSGAPHYREQVQEQVDAVGSDGAWFVIGRPSGMTYEWVERDPDWLDSRYEALVSFRSEFLSIIADPERAAPYRAPRMDERTDPEWADLSIQYLDVLAEEARLSERKARLRDQLIALSPNGTAKGAGITLVRSERQGSVAYARALKENLPGLDLNKYRGEPSVVWTVRRSGEGKEN